LAFLAESFALFAVKDFERKVRKVNAKAATKSLARSKHPAVPPDSESQRRSLA